MRIAIVGAGVAGAAAALLLKLKGARVDLLDMSRDYVKPCGEVVPAWLPELVSSLGLPAPRTLNIINKFVFMSGRRVLREFSSDNAVWASIDKTEWVNTMRNKAGTIVRTIKSPKALISEGYDVVMDARGPFTTMGRKITVWRAYMDIDVEEAVIILHPRLAGLAWIFPHGNHANVGGGFVGVPEPRRLSTIMISEALNSLGYGTARIWGDYYSLVTVWPRISLGEPRVPRLGEAAGLINSLGGEGIRPALLSAAAAAEAYGSKGEPITAWKEYRERVKGLVVEARLASLLLTIASAVGPALLTRVGDEFLRDWLGGRLGLATTLRGLAALARPQLRAGEAGGEEYPGQARRL